MKRKMRQYGQATLELVAIIILILSALLIFQKYIVRTMMGRWKMAGDALGKGKIYSPSSTVECAYEYRFSPPPGAWYDVKCFYADPSCPPACFSPSGFGADPAKCRACVSKCYNPACEDDWGGT